MNVDGISLLLSIIHHLNELPCEQQLLSPSHGPEAITSGTPKVLIATHFHELFKYKMLKESDQIAFYQMEILSQTENKQEDHILFLYK
jgi:hypothetical protein